MPYIRTLRKMTCDIGEQVKTTPSKVMYDNMITSLDVDDMPHDGQVVTNNKYYDKLQECRHAGNSYRLLLQMKYSLCVVQ